MTTTYEHTTTSSSSDGIGLDRIYLRSWNGMLKVAECVLDIIGFICASVWLNWASYGGAWVQFVTMSAFITTLLLYFLHVTRIIYKLPGPWPLIELIYYCLYALMLLISGIVAASRAGWHGSIVATAFFVFAATALYVIDAFLLFRGWKTGTASSSHATTTTTTTTETSYESKTQY